MAVEIGDIVIVGPRYVPASAPPYRGGGQHKADEWTGKQLRVVAACGPDQFALAPLSIVEPTEAHAVACIHRNRLTRKGL